MLCGMVGMVTSVDVHGAAHKNVNVICPFLLLNDDFTHRIAGKYSENTLNVTSTSYGQSLEIVTSLLFAYSRILNFRKGSVQLIVRKIWRHLKSRSSAL